MESSPTTSELLEPDAPEESVAPDGATVLREAMLAAIGELSPAERAQLSAHDQPEDAARAWRDLIAVRAAREREAAVRLELTREFAAQLAAAQPQPTRGLGAQPPAAPPASVAAWTDFIRASSDQSVRQQRRSQFADWLARHPDA